MLLPSSQSWNSQICFLALFPITLVLARKSEEKCWEYAKLVYEREESSILGMDNVYHRVSHCTIKKNPLIGDGVWSRQAEFPHMAAIGYGTKDVSWLCGGIIISDSYILTAAHCLYSHDNGPAAKIRVGTKNLADPDSTMQERDVVETISHPEYKVPATYHDIALLKLNKPFDLNPWVRPACLEIKDKFDDTPFIASGFGTTSFDIDLGSDKLMKEHVNFISEENCNKAYATYFGGRNLPNGLIKNQFCVDIRATGKIVCQNDGLLQRMLQEPYCMYSVVGITNFGNYCGFKDAPVIYTRVSFYLDWIENIVWP